MSGERITRDDLESELRRTLGDADGRIDEARRPLLAGAVLLGLGLVAAAYLAGRRLGRRDSTTVEIRRL